MTYLSAIGDSISLLIKGFTIVLGIIALSIAAKKKQNTAIIIIIISTLIFAFMAPFLSWIISIGYIIWLSSKKEPEKATPAPVAVPAAATTVKSSSKASKSEVKEESEEKKIKCRFCKKSYSADYNGCPYCKKK